MHIEVRDSDIGNLAVAPGAATVVPAHVTIDNRAPVDDDPDYEYLRFGLSPDPPIPGVRADTYVPFPNGSVGFELLPGEGFRISAMATADAPPIFQNMYIESIRMGAHDALNEGLQFDGDPGAKIEIVIGTKPGSVNGRVVNERNEPAINSVVVLVPDVARRNNSEAYLPALTDISGLFHISRIPPGDYKLFAWDDVENNAWQDAEFMKRYETAGSRFMWKSPVMTPSHFP